MRFDTDGRGAGRVTTETETGAMRPQPRKPVATRSWKGQEAEPSSSLQGSTALPWFGPCNTDFGLLASRL